MFTLSEILQKASLQNGVSDVHIQPGRISFREFGELKPQTHFGTPSIQELQEYVKEVSSRAPIDFQERGNFDGLYEQRFRINICGANQGGAFVPNITCRILSLDIPLVETLGFPSERSWEEIVKLKRGLVLVTGITGSGKSTTLASLINHINQNQYQKIVTLEQPIEYTYPRGKSFITQREVPLSLVSFADGVREALRQDPDVILVGETRDKETAHAVLQATETGHLVFSTLHTSRTSEAISRMEGFYSESEKDRLRYDLASNLSRIIAQQLVPRIAGGRALALEILINSPAVTNHIRTGEAQKNIPSYLQTGMRLGNIPMDESLLALYRSKIISPETALSYAHDQNYLRAKLISEPLI